MHLDTLDLSPDATRDEKIKTLTWFLTEGHIDTFGGYPHDHVTLAGWLIVADLDDGKDRAATRIVRHRLSDLVEWYDRALRYFIHQGECDVAEALHETAGGGGGACDAE